MKYGHSTHYETTPIRVSSPFSQRIAQVGRDFGHRIRCTVSIKIGYAPAASAADGSVVGRAILAGGKYRTEHDSACIILNHLELEIVLLGNRARDRET